MTPTRGDSSRRVHGRDSDDPHVAARRDEFVAAEKEPRVEACPVEGESEFDALRSPDRLGAGAERRARPIGARPRKQRDASAKLGLERVGASCTPSVKVLDENRARRLSISQKPLSESRFASPQRPGRHENERMRSPIRGEFFRLVLVQRDVKPPTAGTFTSSSARRSRRRVSSKMSSSIRSPSSIHPLPKTTFTASISPP